MELKEISQLVRLIERSDIAEFELERDGTVIRIRRAIGGHAAGVAAPAPVATAVPVAVVPSALPHAPPPVGGDRRPAAEVDGHLVTSPFIGTFYRAPAPDTPPYVEVGSVVKKGQVLCIVEAMKLMNEIESEVDGRVARIYPDNGQPVEYGAPLFQVVPA